MRKLLRFSICLLIIAFSATSWAVPANKKPKFKGFYIGVDGGVDSWNLRNTVEFFDTSVSSVYPVARNDTNVGRLGGSGGLFFGYAFTEGQTYGSLEINLDGLSNRHNSKIILSGVVGSEVVATEFVVSEKQEYGGSIDFHGGYIFNNVAMVYITAGYAVERFKSEAQYAILYNSEYTYTTNTQINATRIGIGSEFAIQRNWRIRLETFEKFYSNKPYFLSDLVAVQALTDGNTINATRNYLAYYVGILRQF